MKQGSLVVVGTGIQLVGQVTLEARTYIEQADKVLFLAADPATSYWIQELNPSAESLHTFYQQGKERMTSYIEMIERILSEVRKGQQVCVTFYGHPGVFVYPSHEAIRRARLEGFSAKMLPGISAEDCLFADLGIDPAMTGCQSFEATDFLIHKRTFDTYCSLVLWQVGVIGDLTFNQGRPNKTGLHVLIEHLEQYYGSDHLAIVYEAAQYPICDPVIDCMPLGKVREARVTSISTLYVLPVTPAPLDREMLDRLGINPSLLISSKHIINTSSARAKGHPQEISVN